MVLATNGAYFGCGVLEHSSKASGVFLVSVLGGGWIWILLNTHLILVSKYPVRWPESSSKLQEWRSRHWRARQVHFDGAGRNGKVKKMPILRITSGSTWTQAVPIREFWVMDSIWSENLVGVCPQITRLTQVSALQRDFRQLHHCPPPVQIPVIHTVTSDPPVNAGPLSHPLLEFCFQRLGMYLCHSPVKLEPRIGDCVYGRLWTWYLVRYLSTSE